MVPFTQQLRHRDPIDVRILRPDGKVGERDLGYVDLQIDVILQRELVGRVQIDLAGVDQEIQPILQILPDGVRLQPVDLELAVGLDRLHRQMPVPLDPLAELGRAAEGEAAAVDPGGEIVQLEIDRLQSRREIARAGCDRRSVTNPWLTLKEPMRSAGKGSLLFGSGFGAWEALVGRSCSRFKRPSLPTTALTKGAVDVDVAEGVGAVPDRRQLEVDEQAFEAEQLVAARVGSARSP